MEPMRFVQLHHRMAVPWLLLALLIGGCRQRPAGIVTPEPIPMLPDSVETARPRPVIRADRAQYHLESTVRTEQVDTTPPVREVAARSETFEGIVEPSPDGGFRLTLRSDSASLPTGPQQPDTGRFRLTTGFDSLGAAYRAPGDTSDMLPCTSPPTLLSPLLVQLFTIGLAEVPTSRSNTLPAVSVSYRTCTGGIFPNLSLTITPDSTRFRQNFYSVTGTLQSDSTRQFPMHLTGRIRGSAMVVPDSTNVVLAQFIRYEWAIDITAVSSLRRQVFRQTTSTTVTRRD